jgi:hypothetical protein
LSEFHLLLPYSCEFVNLLLPHLVELLPKYSIYETLNTV